MLIFFPENDLNRYYLIKISNNSFERKRQLDFDMPAITSIVCCLHYTIYFRVERNGGNWKM